MPFLEDSEFKPLKHDLKVGSLVFDERYYGRGCRLEIIVGRCQKPSNTLRAPPPSELKKDLLEAHRKQKAKRPHPVLAIICCDDEFRVCGPYGEKKELSKTSDDEAVKRICLYALRIRNHNACSRYLQETLPLLKAELPGIKNEGLLSTHELKLGVRTGEAWEEAQKHSLPLLRRDRRAGVEIFEDLGYGIKEKKRTSILSTQDGKIAVALLLNDDLAREAKSSHYEDYTPLAYAFAEARQENLPWVLMLQWNKVRIYSTDSDFGISKNPADTSFIEVCPAILEQENAGFLWMLLSSKALTTGGLIYGIKKQSERYAAKLSEDLRARVYGDVMPSLVQGVMEARKAPNPDRKELDLVYEIAINILYRLLLVAYAEDRNYLPYDNEAYQERSLKQKAWSLSSQKVVDPKSHHHWTDIQTLWEAIYAGNKEFGLPEYGGSILSQDKSESEIGCYISRLKIKNKFLVPALKRLLLTETGERPQAIDFRSLSIREFGSIYEVMLEKEVTLAKEDIKIEDELIAKKGEVYIHDKSGSRKMSGSFYTPEPLVNHLLDRSLEPAIAEHLGRLDNCPDEDLPGELFRFSVADIAMGSGHFLIAAIDRIESRFTEWLRKKESKSIEKLVKKLERAARKNIKACEAQMEIDTRNIFRRIIAYSCIYGVDINRPAVTLARLSIWLYTFVPGLPLFLLDRNLKHGNSLVGIASIDDIRASLQEDNLEFFGDSFSSYFSPSEGPTE